MEMAYYDEVNTMLALSVIHILTDMVTFEKYVCNMQHNTGCLMNLSGALRGRAHQEGIF